MATVEARDIACLDTVVPWPSQARGDGGQPAARPAAEAAALAGVAASEFEQLRLREAVTRSLGC